MATEGLLDFPWAIVLIICATVFIVLALAFLINKKVQFTKFFKKADKISGLKNSVLGNSMPLLGQAFKENKV